MLILTALLILMVTGGIRCGCVPGSTVKFPCKKCFCLAGKPANCVRVPCSVRDTIEKDKPPLIPTQRTEKRCEQMGQYFEDGCSLCYCTKNGFVGLCTPC